MKFNRWIQRKGEYVNIKEVLRYLKNKYHPKAIKVEKEILSTEDVLWIPSAVYEDEYYAF